jgi:hypothetical protein
MDSWLRFAYYLEVLSFFQNFPIKIEQKAGAIWDESKVLKKA